MMGRLWQQPTVELAKAFGGARIHDAWQALQGLPSAQTTGSASPAGYADQVSTNVDSIPLHRGATVQECQQKIAAYERFVNLQMHKLHHLSAQNAAYSEKLQRIMTSGGSSRSRLLQDDLVSVKHQLQDAQEQVQHRSESLLAATRRCSDLTSERASTHLKLLSQEADLAAAKTQIHQQNEVLEKFKHAWVSSHWQNKQIREELARCYKALGDKDALLMHYAPGKVPPSALTPTLPCLRLPSQIVAVSSTGSTKVAASLAADAQLIPAVHRTAPVRAPSCPSQQTAATMLRQSSAAAAIPAAASRLATSSASLVQPEQMFSPSTDPQDVAAVQQSVTLLQHVSSIPLYPKQSVVSPPTPVQSVGGYTFGAQPNHFAALISSITHPMSNFALGNGRPAAVGSNGSAARLQSSRWPAMLFGGVNFLQGSSAPDIVSCL